RQGWLVDYLRDPGAALGHLLAVLREQALAWGPIVVPLLALAIAGWVTGRRWWRTRCQRTLERDARCVRVLAPPTVDPAGGTAAWSNLVGLLRPAWKRFLTGQPHLAFEYLFGEHGVTIQLWVPGVIPPR